MHTFNTVPLGWWGENQDSGSHSPFPMAPSTHLRSIYLCSFNTLVSFQALMLTKPMGQVSLSNMNLLRQGHEGISKASHLKSFWYLCLYLYNLRTGDRMLPTGTQKALDFYSKSSDWATWWQWRYRLKVSSTLHILVKSVFLHTPLTQIEP